MIGFCYNSKRVELYDPSQARDNSGKWTGGGSSSEDLKTQASNEINNIAEESGKRAEELREEYKEDKQEKQEWEKIFEENTESKEEISDIARTALLYTSGGEEDEEEIQDDEGNDVVVYKNANSVPAINGEGFAETVNSILRGNNEPVGEKKDFDKTVQKIDKFISIAPKNQADTIYRGVFTRNMGHDRDGKITSWSKSDNDTFALAKNIQIGDIVSDLGFLSASQSERAARKFSGDSKFDDGEYFDLKKDSGAKIFMTIKNSSGYGAVVPRWASPWSEKEILLPRGTKLKVLNVDRKEIQQEDQAAGSEKNLVVNLTTEVVR